MKREISGCERLPSPGNGPGRAQERGEKLKQTWEPIELTYVGRLDEVLLQGGGKLSQTGGDPGEPRKEKPH